MKEFKQLIGHDADTYIPYVFATNHPWELWGMTQEQHTILVSGTAHPDYANTWFDFLHNARYTDSVGRIWQLTLACNPYNQDGLYKTLEGSAFKKHYHASEWEDFIELRNHTA